MWRPIVDHKSFHIGIDGDDDEVEECEVDLGPIASYAANMVAERRLLHGG